MFSTVLVCLLAEELKNYLTDFYERLLGNRGWEEGQSVKFGIDMDRIPDSPFLFLFSRIL